MAIADLKRNNVIYAGGVPMDYTVRVEREAGVAFAPGAIVYDNGSRFDLLPDNSDGALAMVVDKNYLQAGHIGDSYAAGDLVSAIVPLPGMFLYIKAGAGTYSASQPVSVQSGIASQSATNVFAHVVNATTISNDGDLLLVRIK